jgi:hypothetical protein
MPRLESCSNLTNEQITGAWRRGLSVFAWRRYDLPLRGAIALGTLPRK